MQRKIQQHDIEKMLSYDNSNCEEIKTICGEIFSPSGLEKGHIFVGGLDLQSFSPNTLQKRQGQHDIDFQCSSSQSYPDAVKEMNCCKGERMLSSITLFCRSAAISAFDDEISLETQDSNQDLAIYYCPHCELQLGSSNNEPPRSEQTPPYCPSCKSYYIFSDWQNEEKLCNFVDRLLKSNNQDKQLKGKIIFVDASDNNNKLRLNRAEVKNEHCGKRIFEENFILPSYSDDSNTKQKIKTITTEDEQNKILQDLKKTTMIAQKTIDKKIAEGNYALACLKNESGHKQLNCVICSMPLLERKGRGTICVTCPKIRSKARKQAKSKRLEEREALKKVHYVDVGDMITETGTIDPNLTKFEKVFVENKKQLNECYTQHESTRSYNCSNDKSHHASDDDSHCDEIERKSIQPYKESQIHFKSTVEDFTNSTQKITDIKTGAHPNTKDVENSFEYSCSPEKSSTPIEGSVGRCGSSVLKSNSNTEVVSEGKEGLKGDMDECIIKSGTEHERTDEVENETKIEKIAEISSKKIDEELNFDGNPHQIDHHFNRKNNPKGNCQAQQHTSNKRIYDNSQRVNKDGTTICTTSTSSCEDLNALFSPPRIDVATKEQINWRYERELDVWITMAKPLIDIRQGIITTELDASNAEHSPLLETKELSNTSSNISSQKIMNLNHGSSCSVSELVLEDYELTTNETEGCIIQNKTVNTTLMSSRTSVGKNLDFVNRDTNNSKSKAIHAHTYGFFDNENDQKKSEKNSGRCNRPRPGDFSTDKTQLYHSSSSITSYPKRSKDHLDINKLFHSIKRKQSLHPGEKTNDLHYDESLTLCGAKDEEKSYQDGSASKKSLFESKTTHCGMSQEFNTLSPRHNLMADGGSGSSERTVPTVGENQERGVYGIKDQVIALHQFMLNHCDKKETEIDVDQIEGILNKIDGSLGGETKELSDAFTTSLTFPTYASSQESIDNFECQQEIDESNSLHETVESVTTGKSSMKESHSKLKSKMELYDRGGDADTLNDIQENIFMVKELLLRSGTSSSSHADILFRVNKAVDSMKEINHFMTS